MVEGLKFLGLRSGDAFWMACGIDTDGQDVDSIMVDTSEVMELQYITLRERQRARGLLGRLVDEMASDSSEDELQVHMLEKWDWHESGTDSEKRQNVQDLKREVQICLLLGYKVELEILERRPGGLAHWLLSQIEQ